MSPSRRSILKTLAQGLAGATLLGSRVVLAASPGAGDPRFVLVLLRGALDGLAAVPPVGDPHYSAVRGALAIPSSGESAAMPLAGPFALHPSLVFLHERWIARELLVVHGVASPYRDRSHFDAQDVLEAGTTRPHASASGWLNRALESAALLAPRREESGIALAQNIPLALRGTMPVTSWAPSAVDSVDEDTLARLADLYASDAVLARRLAEATALDGIARGADRGMDPRARAAARLRETARVAGSFLARDEGPRVAMLESGGWDTHANQGAAEGGLATRLTALDASLRAMHAALGSAWSSTVVLVVTEFGRTVAPNGTRGTDHGTGMAAFLLGGAVAGGRVVADWPGLGPRDLFEGRDLRPTLDLRAVLKGVLGDHLGVPSGALDRSVFPGSAGVRAVPDLVSG
jgi:uncharacterized protein (DUF1501 family)